ncbi:MAG TPA: CbbQ/NirQ/NorQ/GpvN family protein [Acidiferrobacter sp.]|nr:CbbQ/NirQ/NorQ/GpvN family protein [Acidiferrobacter sp.]
MRSLIDRLRGVERDIVQHPDTQTAPYYEPQGAEVAIFEAAWRRRLPVMLKGPTGCGKTRFLEYMAHRLHRPLVSVSCHEDLTSADLVGRFLLEGESTVWQDGPLTRAVKVGAICYLDEIVEARTDSTVIIHPLTDHRRRLPIEKRGVEIEAHEDFLLVISYNPGYQTVLKDLKPSTKQRFVAITFHYPIPEIEARIVQNEVEGVSADLAARLVAIAGQARALKDHGLDEASSTRSLVYTAALIAAGLSPLQAGEAALVSPLTDDIELAEALREIVTAHLGPV